MVLLVSSVYLSHIYIYIYIYLFILACVDSYLTPSIQRYVQGFLAGFKDPVSGELLMSIILIIIINRII